MSTIHQIEAVLILLCLGVGFHQASEYQWDRTMEFEYRTETHWSKIIPYAVKNLIIVHAFFVGTILMGKGLEIIWNWLGGL